MNPYFQTPSERYMQEERERKNIKYISIVAGLCVIGYVLIQNLLSIILMLSPLYELYLKDAAIFSVVSIVFSVCGLLIPFGIGGYFIGKKTKTMPFNFDAPVSTPLMLWAVPFGFFVCLAGNYITSIFVNFMSKTGVELSAPDFPVPTDFAGRIVYALAIAVVPALVEEFAIRGAILQPLRKYGDKFAILASAIIFAVLHGNLIQAPFALIAGIGIGYAVCITNSLWTGVLIHFCNNLYSVVTEFMVMDITDENELNRIYSLTMIALYIISILGSVIFVIVKGKRKLLPSFTAVSEGRKMKAFILTIPMIIALLMMISITSEYISAG